MEEPLTSAGWVCHILVDTDLRVESIILVHILIQIDNVTITIAIVVIASIGRLHMRVMRLSDFALGMWIDQLIIFVVRIVAIVIIIIIVVITIFVIVIIIATALQRILVIEGIVLILGIGQQWKLGRGLIKGRAGSGQGGVGGGDGATGVVN